MRISDWSSDVCSSDLLFFSNTSRITSPISCGRFRVVLLESVMGLRLFFRFLSLHQGPESLRLGLHLVNGTGLLIGIMGDEAMGDETFVVKHGSDGPEGGRTTSKTHIRSNKSWNVTPILLIQIEKNAYEEKGDK